MWQWCRHTLKSREIWMGWRQWTESCVRSASLDTFGFLLVVDKTCPDVWSSLRPIQGMSLSIWCSEQPSGRCQWCLEWSRRSPWSWEKRNDFCKSLDIPNIPVASNIPGFVSVWRLAILPFIFPGEFGHPIFSVQTWKGNSIFFILIGLSMVHGEWRPCNSTDVPIRARIVSSLDALIPSFFSGRVLKNTSNRSGVLSQCYQRRCGVCIIGGSQILLSCHWKASRSLIPPMMLQLSHVETLRALPKECQLTLGLGGFFGLAVADKNCS